MDDTRLARLREELNRARKKRDDWETKVKDLERKYKEAENTCIHDLVHAANLTPEQLAELIRMAASYLPQVPGGYKTDNEHLNIKAPGNRTVPVIGSLSLSDRFSGKFVVDLRQPAVGGLAVFLVHVLARLVHRGHDFVK